ncbi:GH12178 [Drosophila grimshawi]|uniref:GH12178 n=2 Tax=Drosophila grimshawi TaxID=7222 RepID=B4JJU4_DROGR|nr:GH12178 [Drosophila grimshawi]
MNVSDFKPVLTRAALALKKTADCAEFTALVFQEAPAKTNTVEKETGKTTKDNKSLSSGETDNEFNMKRARNEVLNFAMANQRTIKNKRKMEIVQLIKLGAKAPKKPYRNYKELKEERKRLKDNREERKKFHQLGKNQTGAASVKCNQSQSHRNHAQKKRAPVANISQHYGKAQPKFKKRNKN